MLENYIEHSAFYPGSEQCAVYLVGVQLCRNLGDVAAWLVTAPPPHLPAIPLECMSPTKCSPFYAPSPGLMFTLYSTYVALNFFSTRFEPLLEYKI